MNDEDVGEEKSIFWIDGLAVERHLHYKYRRKESSQVELSTVSQVKGWN